MELKHVITRFVYRVQPKPEGGFIARASDPSVPPLEAPTREELQQKIQQAILSGLADELPGLKLPLPGTKTEFAFHVEHGPDGSFSIHSADPQDGVVKTASPEGLQGRVLEKLLNFAGKQLTPELSQTLARLKSGGEVKVVVSQNVLTANGARKMTADTSKLLPPGITLQNKTLTPGSVQPNPIAVGGTIGDAPILPEKSGFGKFLRLLLTISFLAAVVYFLLHR